MLADFTIHIHELRKPVAVQVKIHDSTSALRSAITQFGNRNDHRTRRQKEKKKLPTAAEEEILGVCHRWHWQDDPVVAMVRLAPPHIGIGIVTHELAHAAVWLREIENQFEDIPLTCANDELFCWILGDLVRQTTIKLYEKGIWTEKATDGVAETT